MKKISAFILIVALSVSGFSVTGLAAENDLSAGAEYAVVQDENATPGEVTEETSSDLEAVNADADPATDDVITEDLAESVDPAEDASVDPAEDESMEAPAADLTEEDMEAPALDLTGEETVDDEADVSEEPSVSTGSVDASNAAVISIKDATVSAISAKTYTGSAIKPKPTVKVNGKTLKNNTDYTLAYKNNINAGTATVTITGKGQYTDSISKTFKITPKKVTPTVKLSTYTYLYNGKVRKPRVTVTADGKNFTRSTCTVTYDKGRKAVGIYKVKVTLKGNYSGTKTVSFKIKPTRTQITKVTAGNKSFVVKWNRQTVQTTGYQVQYSANKSFKNAKTKLYKNTTRAGKISGLKVQKKYYVRIRTYKLVNGKRIFSNWSSVKTVTTKPAPLIQRLDGVWQTSGNYPYNSIVYIKDGKGTIYRCNSNRKYSKVRTFTIKRAGTFTVGKKSGYMIKFSGQDKYYYLYKKRLGYLECRWHKSDGKIAYSKKLSLVKVPRTLNQLFAAPYKN